MMYHGTRAGFRGSGGLVLPASSHQRAVRPGNSAPEFAYATTDPELATWYAEQGGGRGRPKLLTVAPLGDVEPDPSPWYGEFNQFRCHEGFIVLKVSVIKEVAPCPE